MFHTRVLRTIFLGLFYIEYSTAAQQYDHSCADVYKHNILQTSGVYTIYNRANQPYQVYCQFHQGYGYTYVSPDTRVTVNIDDLYTNSSYILVRDMRTNGQQYQATIGQISRYSSRQLSIQFNAHTGYQAMQNIKMTPYLYVGLIPVSGISHKGDVQGYKVNGHDVTFSNCDGNPNSYFSFLFNQNHVAETGYHPTDSPLLHQWVDRAVLQRENIPASFFSFFEVHFGGCGGYGTPTQFPGISGAALGLRYDMTCPQPVDITGGSKVVTSTKYGSTVTYTCDGGYTRLYGDLTQQCAATGKWTGLTPFCGRTPCDSQPCQNGGTCFTIEGSEYVCECLEGFLGKYCHVHL